MTITSQSLIVAGRKRGRPRAAEPGSAVCVWVTQSDHDRLIKLANQRGESVSAVAKSLLMVRLPKG